MAETAQPQPLISPSPDATHFWEAAARHVLMLPQCTDCNQPFFYPRVLCPTCGSRNLTWLEASGSGTLYAFCIHYHSDIPGLRESVPFATALVDLDEGPLMMAFLLGVPADPDHVRVGTRLAVEFLDLDDGQTALGFRPSPEGT